MPIKRSQIMQQAQNTSVSETKRTGEAAPGPGYETMGRTKMTLQQWIDLPDCPRQRDIKARIATATHLDVFEPIHAEVAMAVLPDGRRFKLDGHTRAAKWAMNPAQAPVQVSATVYLCDSLEVIKTLYTRMDNKVTVETARQQVSGLARYQAIGFRSRMMESGSYGNALKALYAYARAPKPRGMTDEIFLDQAIAAYRNELILLDTIMPTSTVFVAGTTMAALSTLSARGESALVFWRKFQAREGVKSGTAMDPVQALLEATLAARPTTPGRYKETAQHTLFKRAVTAFCGWERKEVYIKGVKLMSEENLLAFCQAAGNQA
jgi:hypothetical protein